MNPVRVVRLSDEQSIALLVLSVKKEKKRNGKKRIAVQRKTLPCNDLKSSIFLEKDCFAILKERDHGKPNHVRWRA